MNPKRTFEAIDNVLSAELTSGDLVGRDDLIALAGNGLTYNTGNDELDVDKNSIFENPTFTGTVTIDSEGSLTGVPNPTNNNDAANKSYVDQLAQGIKARSQALVLVGTPLAGTYDSEPALHEFEAAANGAFPAVDGVSSETLNVVGARIVLAAQANAAHNGLYVLKTIGDSETK